MKLRILLPCFIAMLIVSGCKKEDKKITSAPEGSINLSELADKHDYYLPFAVINDTNIISSAILNNETIRFGQGDFIEFTENGFYELILKYNDPQQANDTFLFTTKTEERELSEWGIRAWTPAPFISSQLSTEDIGICYPRRYAGSMKVPFIFYVNENGVRKSIYCQAKYMASGEKFNIKQAR
jgi:hypothetical protein